MGIIIMKSGDFQALMDKIEDIDIYIIQSISKLYFRKYGWTMMRSAIT